MSSHDLVSRLADALTREAACLDELHATMCASRTAYVALRPTQLSDSTRALDAIAERCTAASRAREEGLAALGRATGQSDTPTMSALLRQLPPLLADSLRRASDRAAAAATRVRIENRLSGSLLRQARAWHESLLGSIQQPGVQTVGYDRSGRVAPAAESRGTLLRGTV